MSVVSWAVPGSSITRITWRNKRDTKKFWTWCQLKYHQVNLCPVPLIETDAACGFFRLPNNPAALFLVVLLYRWAKWRFREVKWLTLHFIVRGRDKLCPDSWTLTSSPCSPNGGLRYMGMEVGEEICHWFPKGEGTHRVYSMKPSATGTVGDDCWQKPPSQTKMGLDSIWCAFTCSQSRGNYKLLQSLVCKIFFIRSVFWVYHQILSRSIAFFSSTLACLWKAILREKRLCVSLKSCITIVIQHHQGTGPKAKESSTEFKVVITYNDTKSEQDTCFQLVIIGRLKVKMKTKTLILEPFS